MFVINPDCSEGGGRPVGPSSCCFPGCCEPSRTQGGLGCAAPTRARAGHFSGAVCSHTATARPAAPICSTHRAGARQRGLSKNVAGSELGWVRALGLFSCLMQELSSCSAPGCPVHGTGTRLWVLTGLCFPADPICSCLCNPCKNSWVEPCCWLLGGAFFMESQSQ